MKKKPAHSSKPQDKAAPALAEERQRISRELHDRALQLLSSVKLRAEVCRNELLNDRNSLAVELQTIENEVDTAIVEIRNILSETHDNAQLAAGSLERRLKAELEIFRARTGLNLDFSCTVVARDLPYKIERELYFTLREGVLNAVRHARASHLSLSLSRDGATCVACLTDNGIGFDTSLAEGGTHYGLRSMRERIKKIGGTLALESAPGAGTKITIRIPLDKPALKAE